jgi:uncharacterized protein (TIGR00255 family)
MTRIDALRHRRNSEAEQISKLKKEKISADGKIAEMKKISEEITRLRSHLALMAGAGARDEPYGRKLEFITQEMFREANTMSSKATDAEMVQEMLDIKSEIEGTAKIGARVQKSYSSVPIYIMGGTYMGYTNMNLQLETGNASILTLPCP